MIIGRWRIQFERKINFKIKRPRTFQVNQLNELLQCLAISLEIATQYGQKLSFKNCKFIIRDPLEWTFTGTKLSPWQTKTEYYKGEATLVNTYRQVHFVAVYLHQLGQFQSFLVTTKHVVHQRGEIFAENYNKMTKKNDKIVWLFKLSNSQTIEQISLLKVKGKLW